MSLKKSRDEHKDSGDDASGSAEDAREQQRTIFAVDELTRGDFAENDGSEAGDDLKDAVLNGAFDVKAPEENRHDESWCYVWFLKLKMARME